MVGSTPRVQQEGAALVLGVLATAQFLMTLDSSVMNVSMARVASDLDAPITGIQTAITLYTLVMASLMVTGGKIGTLLGRRRAFGIGVVIYGAGSLTTAVAPNLAVLLIGWSLLEGIGAALILPAVVALVAANFPAERRTYAYGMVAAAGATAVAAGPLIGGAVTTFASWRYVFVGEVAIVVLILLALRRVADVPAAPAELDRVGAVLSVVSLGLIVLAVLRSAEWGWVVGPPGAPVLLGMSPVVTMLASGLLLLHAFLRWEQRLVERGREPLLPPDLLRVPQLAGGLTVLFAQFVVQAGVFFALPLFLTVVLELTALETGLRVFPLSLALLVGAVGIPRFAPHANPRRLVRAGIALLALGCAVLAGGMDPGADARVVAVPMLLIGLGLGALASQLGAVAVSAVPSARASDVGGLQNTFTNLGASLGTALVGSVLIASLSTSVLTGLVRNPEVPPELSERAEIELAAGVSFLSDPQVRAALEERGVADDVADVVVEVNGEARLAALRSAFGLTGLLALAALLATGRVPTRPLTRAQGEGESALPPPAGT